jgi:general stress protein YciG
MSDGELTLREAGRRGGQTTYARHGREHLAAAGRKGGRVTAETRGREQYAAMGRKGGQAVRSRRPDHFETIGRKGGQALARARGSAYFAEMGRRGGQAGSGPRVALPWLAERRRAAGLSQTALARAVGVSQSMVSQLELGGRCGEATARKLAEALGAPHAVELGR